MQTAIGRAMLSHGHVPLTEMFDNAKRSLDVVTALQKARLQAANTTLATFMDGRGVEIVGEFIGHLAAPGPPSTALVALPHHHITMATTSRPLS